MLNIIYPVRIKNESEWKAPRIDDRHEQTNDDRPRAASKDFPVFFGNERYCVAMSASLPSPTMKNKEIAIMGGPTI
jgi:hypothetical protein